MVETKKSGRISDIKHELDTKPVPGLNSANVMCFMNHNNEAQPQDVSMEPVAQ